MSLRKSPARTQAFLEANRCNAQKSIGPHTRRGKAQTALNAMRRSMRSRVYRNLWYRLFYAPACSVDRTARAILTPQQAAHPLFADVVDQFREAEARVVMDSQWERELLAVKRQQREAGKVGPVRPKPAEADDKPVRIMGLRGPVPSNKDVNHDDQSRNVAENKGKRDFLSGSFTGFSHSSKRFCTKNAHFQTDLNANNSAPT